MKVQSRRASFKGSTKGLFNMKCSLLPIFKHLLELFLHLFMNKTAYRINVCYPTNPRSLVACVAKGSLPCSASSCPPGSWPFRPTSLIFAAFPVTVFSANMHPGKVRTYGELRSQKQDRLHKSRHILSSDLAALTRSCFLLLQVGALPVQERRAKWRNLDRTHLSFWKNQNLPAPANAEGKAAYQLPEQSTVGGNCIEQLSGMHLFSNGLKKDQETGMRFLNGEGF
jgi:hypothetical protein